MKQYLVTVNEITRLISADTETIAIEIFIAREKERLNFFNRFIHKYRVKGLSSGFTNTFMVDCVTEKITYIED